jgi:hypothetical protein
LTEDDLASQRDAFDSLFLDAPITNYLCADRPFTLHEKTVELPEKGLLVLATDGAYHALPTPMHLEALLLDTLEQAASKRRWKTLLTQSLPPAPRTTLRLILHPSVFLPFEDSRPFLTDGAACAAGVYPARRASRTGE